MIISHTKYFLYEKNVQTIKQRIKQGGLQPLGAHGAQPVWLLHAQSRKLKVLQVEVLEGVKYHGNHDL
jgi:hypothetical protein